MTLISEDQALRNYAEICQTEHREILLLDEDFEIVFFTDTAKKQYPEMAPAYFRVLMDDEEKKKIKKTLNEDRFYVDAEFITDRIIVFYRIDIPSDRQYYELTLYENSPLSSQLDPLEKMGLLSNMIVSGEGQANQVITQFQRESELFADHYRLQRGVYHCDQRVTVRHCCNVMEQASEIAAALGVLLDYQKVYMHSEIQIPITAVKIMLYLTAAFLKNSMPGDIILFDFYPAYSENHTIGQLCFSLSFPVQGAEILLEEIARLELIIAKEMAEYIGAELELSLSKQANSVQLTLRPYETTVKDIFPLDLTRMLLQAVSNCISVAKIRKFTLQHDFILNWRMLPKEIYYRGNVSEFIDSVCSRLNKKDYRDLYGNHLCMNLHMIRDLAPELYKRENRLSGITDKKMVDVGDKRIPIEIYEKIAAVYGITYANLSAPNFLLNIMTGRNLNNENMICVDRSPIGFLVFDAIQSQCPDFATTNRAFSNCKKALDTSVSETNIAEWIQNCVSSIKTEYFDQSIPIGEKIGNNVTLLRLFNKLTIEEAAQQADISVTKLQELEQGNITNIYCRELDRICRVYQEDSPPSLFFNGYILFKLWRKDFLKYGVPPTLIKNIPGFIPKLNHWNESEAYDWEKRRQIDTCYKEILESSQPVLFLDESQTILRKNFKLNKDMGISWNKDDPIFDIFHCEIIFWIGRHAFRLTPPNPIFPKIHLIELERDNQACIYLANIAVPGDSEDDIQKILDKVGDEK